jgi:CshA-type fibril repeat protein
MTGGASGGTTGRPTGRGAGQRFGRRFGRRFAATSLRLLTVLAVTVGTLVALTGPARAAVACGGAAQNGLTIKANHASTFYTDFGDGFDASYVGYEITNSGAPRTDLWVRAGGFTGGSVTLADATDDRRQIAALAGSASATRFFLVKAAAVSAAPQAHTVDVYDRRPDLTGATVLATCTFTFTAVANTIGANANKVTAITSAPASPAIGQTVTVTVTGQTGQADGAVWVSPAAVSSWPGKALRLEGTTLEVNTNGTGPFEETYTDSLFIPGSIAALYTAQTTYRATYAFRVTRATTTNPVVTPVAQISSGGNFKHTGSYPTLPSISTSGATASVTVGKTITTNALGALPTTTAPNGNAGAITYAEVPYRVQATAASGTALVDEFVDVPSSGVLFKSGSAVLTDATPRTAVSLPDPATSPADVGSLAGALHFTGPFTLTAATPATISYTMYVPLTAGTYANQAYATINGTTIGATPTAVPTVSVTSDGTALTGWSSGTSGGAPAAQSVTFPQPADVSVGAATTTLTATADSGLAVTYASGTTGVCTVSGATVTLVSPGTCTVTASQPGDGSHAAATPVTRSFTVRKLAQAITFAQPAAVALTAGTVTAAATSDSGLPVAVTSGTTGVCTVSGTTVTLVATGTCQLTAAQAGNGTYDAAAPVTRSFAVDPAAQTITFPQPADVLVTAGSATVSASASSTLAVTFTGTTPAVCTVAGSTVTLVTAGTCTVRADQAGDATYAAAPGVTRSFQVTPAVVVVPPVVNPPVVNPPVTPPLPAPGPPPAPATSVSSGTGGQTAEVTLPAGGSLRLVDAAGGHPARLTVPGEGTYEVGGTGRITFRPAPGFVGTATPVTFEVVDAYGRTASATYTPTVTPLPVAPAIAGGAQGGPLAVTPHSPTDRPLAPASVRLVDPQGHSVTRLSVPGVGTFAVAPSTGAISFRPVAGFVGSRTVTFRVQDVDGQVGESGFAVRVDRLAVGAGRDDIESGQVGRVRLTGVPAGAAVVLPAAVRGVRALAHDGSTLRVAPASRFSGEIRIPVAVRHGSATARATAVVTVRPGSAGNATYHVVDGGRTVVTWRQPAGAPARSFTVTVNGRQACSTTATTCTLGETRGPASRIVVSGVGGDGVRTAPAGATYRATSCARLGTVHFGSGSAALTAGAREHLAEVGELLRREGFTRGCLVGHTDNRAGAAYNLRLSRDRVDSVARYLGARAGGVRYLTAHRGESDPAASNGGGAGQAVNRRVEISVA